MPINEPTLEKLRQNLVETMQFADKEMASRSAWGAINFSDAQEDLSSTINVAAALKEMPLKDLPDNIGAQISQHLTAVNNVLKEIDGFSIEQADPANIRTNISNKLTDAAEKLYTFTAPWLAFLSYRRGDIEKTIAELEAAVNEARNIGAQAKTATEKLQKEAENILVSMREAAAESGVAVFTEQFATEARDRDKSAIYWLVATAIGAIATFWAAIIFLGWPELSDDPSTWEMSRVITTKIAILALLFSATVWCGRNFRAMKHQYTINKHRALSLQTFQAFVGATSDPRTKDAVLLEATHAVFGNTPTGFAESGKSGDSGIQFVEIGKSVAEGTADKATS